MKLTVVSPTYNEAENVVALIQAIETALHGLDYEIIIADDDSPDRTWQVAKEYGNRSQRLIVLRRRTDRGLSASVIAAFDLANGEAVACIDADLQHDPRILPQMLRELANGKDLVIGSRYVPGGGTRNWSSIRRLESWIASKMAQVLLGIPLRDPMSGYFMLRRDDFLAVRPKLSGQGFKILLELAANLYPCQISEIPYTFGPRLAGRSKLSRKVVFIYLRQLWRLAKLRTMFSAELVKFLVIGASGTVLNLGTVAFIAHSTSIRDWRASCVATFLATANNYVLNNYWTFRHRSHSGIRFFRKYISFLTVCLGGLLATTATFAAITRFLRGGMRTAVLPVWSLLLAQLIGIGVGTFLNFTLNRAITWPAAAEDRGNATK